MAEAASTTQIASEELAVITTTATKTPTSQSCDPSYPDVCISPPPFLKCEDISYRNFRVLPPDPHRFDRDKDGVGCEE